ncbi:hypothetical protein B0T21DRAFT_443052, partial [Apiosordaria backusii]
RRAFTNVAPKPPVSGPSSYARDRVVTSSHQRSHGGDSILGKPVMYRRPSPEPAVLYSDGYGKQAWSPAHSHSHDYDYDYDFDYDFDYDRVEDYNNVEEIIDTLPTDMIHRIDEIDYQTVDPLPKLTMAVEHLRLQGQETGQSSIRLDNDHRVSDDDPQNDRWSQQEDAPPLPLPAWLPEAPAPVQAAPVQAAPVQLQTRASVKSRGPAAVEPTAPAPKEPTALVPVKSSASAAVRSKGQAAVKPTASAPVKPSAPASAAAASQAPEEDKFTTILKWDHQVHFKDNLPRTGAGWTPNLIDSNVLNTLTRTYKHPGTFPNQQVKESMRKCFEQNFNASCLGIGVSPFEIPVKPGHFCNWIWANNGSRFRLVVDEKTGVFKHYTAVKIWFRFGVHDKKYDVTSVKICLGPAAMNESGKPKGAPKNLHTETMLRDFYMVFKIQLQKATPPDFGADKLAYFYKPYNLEDRVLAALPRVEATVGDKAAWKENAADQPFDDGKMRGMMYSNVRNSWTDRKSIQNVMDVIIYHFKRDIHCSTLAPDVVMAYSKAFQEVVSAMEASGPLGGIIEYDQLKQFAPYRDAVSTIREELEKHVPLALRPPPQKKG